MQLSYRHDFWLAWDEEAEGSGDALASTGRGAEQGLGPHASARSWMDHVTKPEEKGRMLHVFGLKIRLKIEV